MFFKASLQQLYLEDERPWLVGFSGGKDSTMLASLIFDVVRSIPAERRKKAHFGPVRGHASGNPGPSRR
jgi:predicted phosphoadenosine phosphosulfate sulfurtransferase